MFAVMGVTARTQCAYLTFVKAPRFVKGFVGVAILVLAAAADVWVSHFSR